VQFKVYCFFYQESIKKKKKKFFFFRFFFFLDIITNTFNSGYIDDRINIIVRIKKICHILDQLYY